MSAVERVSIEVHTRCEKACAFCYNGSSRAGSTQWTPDDLVAFVNDCAANGVRAVSLGGGEPLEFGPLFELLDATRGRCFRSMTTNGLRLDDAAARRLADGGVDKVHVSIHFPELRGELDRAVACVRRLEAVGIRGGVNLLVRRSGLAAATACAIALRDAGIDNDRVMFLPMRGTDTPTPREVAAVAGGRPFQSMTCLGGCARSPRFCSVDAQRRVAWCSYTVARRGLNAPTHAAMLAALDGLGLDFCGDGDGTPIRLSRGEGFPGGPQHGLHLVRGG